MRSGKERSHVVRLQFVKGVIPIHEKKTPISIKEGVEKKLNKLIVQKHAFKLDNCSDKHFISPIEISVRKNTKKNYLQKEASKGKHRTTTGQFCTYN